MSFDPDQLSTMITHAVAPVFLLGVVAAFLSILLARMTAITDRIRDLNRIDDNDAARKWLKEDVARLKRRLVLLNQSLFLTVTAGIGITILLLVGFAPGQKPRHGSERNYLWRPTLPSHCLSAMCPMPTNSSRVL
jgi:Protein of unknown function (DUF2721)